MSRRPRSVVVPVLAAAGAMTAAAVAAPAASAALTGPQQIAFLNAQRAKHGLPSDVTEVPAWSAACKKHMDYLKATGKFQHHEDAGDPQYTAEGNWGGNHSVLVSAGDAMEADGDNAFEYAPIHLMQMLSPFIKRSGADRGCLVTLGDADPLEAPGTNTERAFATQQTFSYPGDGATGIPVTTGTYEFPYVPAAGVGLNTPGDITRSSGTGPHLYFFYAGPEGSWWSRGAITSAALTGPAGAVEVKTVDNLTPAPAGVGGSPLGNYLSPGGIVIPVKPLTPGTTYTATVNFDSNDPGGRPPVTRTWSFTTSGTAPTPISGGVTGGGATGGSVNSGGGSGTGGTSTPAPPAAPVVPTIAKIKLKTRSVAFDASGAGAVWVTVEQQTRKKSGKTPAKWKTRRSLPVAATAGANRLELKKLAKGKYRVRVRDASATGKILAEKTLAL